MPSGAPAGKSDARRDGELSDIAHALVALEGGPSNLAWRMQAGVAGALAATPHLFPPELSYAEFVPVALRL
eukprot:98205-Chlamydomonas_euryale.AAC.1